MKASTLVDELRAIVGDDHVRTDAETVRENSTDATKRFHPADVVVFPKTALEVSRIVSLANRERTPIVSRGGGGRVCRRRDTDRWRHRRCHAANGQDS